MNPAHPRTLPAELTIYTVAELHPQWQRWLADTGDNATATPQADDRCTLDAADVEQADAAGVQLLLSLSAALEAQGRGLHLHAPSAALLAACEALGLADWAARLQATEETA